MFVGKWIPHPNNTSALITVLTHLTLRVLPFFNQGSLLSIRSGKLNCHHIHIKVFSSISQWSFSVPPQVWEGEDLQLHRRGGGVRQSLPCHEHLRPRHHRAVQGPWAVREAAPPLRHRRRCLQSHEEEEQRHVYRHLRYHGKPPSPARPGHEAQRWFTVSYCYKFSEEFLSYWKNKQKSRCDSLLFPLILRCFLFKRSSREVLENRHFCKTAVK